MTGKIVVVVDIFFVVLLAARQIHLRSAHRCGSRCRGGHHSYLANNGRGESGSGGNDGFMGSGTFSAAAASAAANPATPTDARGGGDTDADTGFTGDGGIFSPGRRHRGRRDGGFFRGDHYCRVSVGRKGAGSGQVEVRIWYRGVFFGV